jgi:hypothetical protein
MFLRKYAPQRLASQAKRIVAVRPSRGLECAKPSIAALKHSIARTDYLRTPRIRSAGNES